MKKILFVLFSLCIWCMGDSYAQTELLTNGDFETGTIGPWVQGGAIATGGCDGPNWTVFSSGNIFAISPCLVAGDPTMDGSFAVYTGFDGFGPLSFSIEQPIVIPTGITQADLSWLEAYFIDHFGSLPRTFSIDLYDGGVLQANLYSFDFPGFVTSDSGGGGTTYIPQLVDVTAILQGFEGQTLDLRISAIVPESFTGGGGFSLDAVSLLVTANPSTVPTLGEWGLIILALLLLNVSIFFVYQRRKGMAVAG